MSPLAVPFALDGMVDRDSPSSFAAIALVSSFSWVECGPGAGWEGGWGDSVFGKEGVMEVLRVEGRAEVVEAGAVEFVECAAEFVDGGADAASSFVLAELSGSCMYSAVVSGKPGWWSGRLSGAPSMGAERTLSCLTSGAPPLEFEVVIALVAAAVESELAVAGLGSGAVIALAAAAVESECGVVE